MRIKKQKQISYRKNLTGPIRYKDKNGVDRLALKEGSPRMPGGQRSHAEMRNAQGKRIDRNENPVRRKDPGNHIPIEWDL